MLFSEFAQINPEVDLKKGEPYPFIEMEDLTPGQRYVFAIKVKEFKGGGSRFQTRDIIFARITPCLEHGKIAQVKGKDNEKYFGSTEFFVFRAKDGISDKGFLFYLSYSDILRKPAEKSMYGASGRQRASLDVVKKIEVPDIPLKEQQKIASILSAYDDLIENNTRRIQILEEMAQRIYREWFVDFRFPGCEKVKFVDSELGKIPEGWEVKEIREFGQIITGKTPSTRDEENYGNYMQFIKTPDMHKNIFIIETGQYLSRKGTETQKNKTLPSGSICVSCIGTAGVVSITNEPSQTNQQINSIVLNDEANLEYLFFSIKNLRDIINSYGRKGATIVNLNKEEFSSLKIVYPSYELVKNYHYLVTDFFKLIRNLLIKNRNLRSSRNFLLPKLISGELDVSNLDIINKRK